MKADDISPENQSCADAIVDFLYNGKEIRVELAEHEKQSISPIPVKRTHNFIGIQGVSDALDVLADNFNEQPESEISIYLSLQYSRLLHDEAACNIFEKLYSMNGKKPIKVVFDSWLADDNNANDRVTKNLQALMPYLQTGKIQLQVIKSTQKFFYYNLTFFARNTGMVITTEPAGGMGVSISMVVDSKDYLNGMGGVFANIDNITKSLARYVSPKEESTYYTKLFEPTEDLQIVSGGITPLYMDEQCYLTLLKLNEIKGGQRQYRHKRFIEDKQRFESFLENHRVKEIISRSSLDWMLFENKIKTPGFSFLESEVKANGVILKSLFQGILRYVEQYKNLSVFLDHGDNMHPDFTCWIKGDSSVLIHTWEEEQNHTVYSDNWMLVYEYIKKFQNALQRDTLMTAKTALKTALQIRLEKLGGL